MIYEIQGGLIIKEIWRPATRWPTCCWRDMGICCTGAERSRFSQLVLLQGAAQSFRKCPGPGPPCLPRDRGTQNDL